MDCAVHEHGLCENFCLVLKCYIVLPCGFAVIMCFPLMIFIIFLLQETELP